MDRKWSSGGWTGIPTPKVGTGTLEKKKNALNKATKELEDKVKNLQQRTRTLPQPNSGHESLRTHRNNSVKSSESFRVSRSLTPPRGQGRLLRELPNTPSRESMKSEDSSSPSKCIFFLEAFDTCLNGCPAVQMIFLMYLELGVSLA